MACASPPLSDSRLLCVSVSVSVSVCLAWVDVCSLVYSGLNHRFAFVALLPNRGLDVEDVLRAFSPSAWPELLKVMEPKRGEVRLPRLSLCTCNMLLALLVCAAYRVGADHAYYALCCPPCQQRQKL